MRRLTIVLCAGLFLCTSLLVGVLSGSPANGAAVLSGPLHTSGNRIYDQSGSEVHLRGLNREGLEHSPTGGSNLNDYEFEMAREWGANIVRVPLNEDYWTQLCLTSNYDLSYYRTVDSVVNWITSRGMVALLELDFNPRFPCDPQAQAPKKMADYPGSVIFWQALANRYKDNPLVAFDLYNEPHDITPDVWLNGGTVSDGLVSWQAAGMQQLYNTIRKTGAQNLVFVSGISWASVAPRSDVAGYNIVYGEHVYTCPNDPPPNCTTTTQIGPGGLLSVKAPYPNPTDPTSLLDRWTTFGSTHPVVVTEFGWPSADSGTFNANMIAGAEQRGRGWIAFAWNGSTVGKFTLVANAGPGAPYDPSPAGVPVKDALSTLP